MLASPVAVILIAFIAVVSVAASVHTAAHFAQGAKARAGSPARRKG